VQHGFAMEYLDGDEVYLWKAALLDEASDRGEAARVAEMIGRIHAASAKPGFDTSPFQNRDDFYALRIEPYLVHTAGVHPDLAPQITPLAEILYDSRQVLVHGDVSPKNILFRAKGPVLLDAECATMGDASFDPSFCLNHLVLKAAHLPTSRNRLLADIGTFWAAYSHHIHWEPATTLETRICRLVPVLMLARIDGKSPVEYLDDSTRVAVRRMATSLIHNPAERLDDLAARVAYDLKDQ
ncbi:MAG: phosphotransferase family protein, partial [Alphaproteobacteria bacterium]